MASYSTEDIRNIALVGHGGAGKTMLVESLLHKSGTITAMGSIERGTTVSDYDPQEKQHQHSISSSIVSMDHRGSHINLIDTPGYPDLIGRALPVLAGVEACAVVINAQNGIEPVTTRMMEYAKVRNLDRLIIVNKIDMEQTDPAALLAQIRAAYGSECLPINLPADHGREVVDCFFQPSGSTTDFSSVEEAHTCIIDQIVELDENLMEIYLEQGQELMPEQLHDPFERALREGHLVPVCFVSAATGAGVDQLLEIFARLMPNPNEANPPEFLTEADADATEMATNPARGHTLAHVFKVEIDPFVGRLSIFRIHQGGISRDSQLFIGNDHKPFKVSHLLKLQGKDHTEIGRAIAGDICALAKVDEIYFSTILHDSHDEDNLYLRPIEVPAPMYGLAIETRSRGDEAKISDALHKLEAEDQSFAVEHNAALNETVIRGIGELHLRIMLEQLKDKYHIEVSTRPPRIAYRETITKQAEGHHRHKKQTGGAGQFGEVFLRVEPLARGAGFEFVDEIAGGVIPRQFIPAIEKGIKQVLDEGAIAGYPMHDLRVRVYDGKQHTVDSKEVAFVTAGRKAFLAAIHQAGAVVLEPIVEINISIPNEYMGDVTGDLSGKRGRVTATQAAQNGMTLINGLVPLSELDNYQSRLKSITGGLGSFTMDLSHYDPVPEKTQRQLIAAYQPTETEEP